MSNIFHILIFFPAVVLIVPVANIVYLGLEKITKQFYVKANATVVFTKPDSVETECKDAICLPSTELNFNRLISSDLTIILDIIGLKNLLTLERIL
jgi:hypothetical protein